MEKEAEPPALLGGEALGGVPHQLRVIRVENVVRHGVQRALWPPVLERAGGRGDCGGGGGNQMHTQAGQNSTAEQKLAKLQEKTEPARQPPFEAAQFCWNGLEEIALLQKHQMKNKNAPKCDPKFYGGS